MSTISLMQAERDLVEAAIAWYDLETDFPEEYFVVAAKLEGAIAKVKVMRRRQAAWTCPRSIRHSPYWFTTDTGSHHCMGDEKAHP
jgi:hypothetical protein